MFREVLRNTITLFLGSNIQENKPAKGMHTAASLMLSTYLISNKYVIFCEGFFQ